jgi:hypothetical protein
MLTSAGIRDICDIITIMGATTQNLITVIIPSMLYLKFYLLDSPFDCNILFATVSVILGLAFMFLAIAGFAY